MFLPDIVMLDTNPRQVLEKFYADDNDLIALSDIYNDHRRFLITSMPMIVTQQWAPHAQISQHQFDARVRSTSSLVYDLVQHVTGLYCVGGFVVSAMQPKRPYKDIDFIIVASGVHHFIRVLQTSLQFLYKSLAPNIKVDEYATPGVLSVYFQETKIQFVLKPYSTLQEYFRQVDLSCCMCAYGYCGLVFNQLGALSYINACLFVIPQRHSPTFSLRIMKYFSRHIAVVLPFLDIDKVFMSFEIKLCCLEFLVHDIQGYLIHGTFVASALNHRHAGNMSADGYIHDPKYKIKAFTHLLPHMKIVDACTLNNICNKDSTNNLTLTNTFFATPDTRYMFSPSWLDPSCITPDDLVPHKSLARLVCHVKDARADSSLLVHLVFGVAESVVTASVQQHHHEKSILVRYAKLSRSLGIDKMNPTPSSFFHFNTTTFLVKSFSQIPMSNRDFYLDFFNSKHAKPNAILELHTLRDVVDKITKPATKEIVCAICNDPIITDEESCIKLLCGHTFHWTKPSGCGGISGVIKFASVRRCPLCRAEF